MPLSGLGPLALLSGHRTPAQNPKLLLDCSKVPRMPMLQWLPGNPPGSGPMAPLSAEPSTPHTPLSSCSGLIPPLSGKALQPERTLPAGLAAWLVFFQAFHILFQEPIEPASRVKYLIHA